MYVEKIEGRFKVILQLLSASRSDIESSFRLVNNEFKENGMFILEAAFTIRGDIDERLFSKFLSQYDELHNK